MATSCESCGKTVHLATCYRCRKRLCLSCLWSHHCPVTAEQAGELEAVAQIEGAPVSEEIRKAAHIEAKKNDAQFQERLRKSLERNEAILKKLAKE